MERLESPVSFFVDASEADRVTEAVWINAGSPAQLNLSGNQLLIPSSIVATIGSGNVDMLASRLSVVLHKPTTVIIDQPVGVWRILPCSDVKATLPVGPLQYQHIARQVHAAIMSTQIKTPEPPKKIPRPANSWILYRQFHHAEVSAAHPDLPNTEISKLIATKWRNESDSERIQWQTLSARVKADHMMKYPEYQYSPRRPGERLQRRSRVRSEHTTKFMMMNDRGEQRLKDAETGRGPNPWDSEGLLDVDEEFMDMLHEHNFLQGAHGICPDLNIQCSDEEFEAMLREQLSERATLNTPPVRYDVPPLSPSDL